MSRQRLAIGEHGDITTTTLAPGKVQARCRYRASNGRTVQRKASGRSADAAKRALKKALAEENSTPGAGDTLTRSTTVKELLERWIADQRAAAEATTQTLDSYERVITRLTIPAIGDLTITETTTRILENHLRSIESTTYRKWVRVVLRRSFQWAVIDGALAVNPARETSSGPRKRNQIKALTVAEAQQLRASIIDWKGDQTYGPRRGIDLLEAVDVILGTGVRLGELLALRWSDVTETTVTVAGTTIRVDNKFVRQDWAKTPGSVRTIPLPPFAQDALARQRARGLDEISDLVFCDLNGGVRDPGNLRRSLRAARGDDLGWVDFRALRRTVATLTADSVDVHTASRLLGHSRLSTTEQHYAAKPPVTPDVTVYLQAFGEPIRAQNVPETTKKPR